MSPVKNDIVSDREDAASSTNIFEIDLGAVVASIALLAESQDSTVGAVRCKETMTELIERWRRPH